MEGESETEEEAESEGEGFGARRSKASRCSLPLRALLPLLRERCWQRDASGLALLPWRHDLETPAWPRSSV